jgi:hypothetical protein
MAKRLETLVIEWAVPGQLKPNPWNPNRQSEHEFQMLCASITDAGFTQPIMVTEITVEHSDEWAPELKNGTFVMGDLVIVDGEHRWRAATHLEMKKVPYVRMPYGAMQARLSTLQMNRARGSEDIELAVDVLRDLETLGVLDWAQESLDINDSEMQELLSDVPTPDALAGDEFAEAWHPAGVLSGDITYDGGKARSGHTQRAAILEEEYKQRVLQAPSETERQQLKRSRQTFQLVLRYLGDEADTVRSAIGDHPAEKILAWCKEEISA